jgi:hypothetical protein
LSHYDIGHVLDMGRAPSEYQYACAELPMDRIGELAADLLQLQFAGRHFPPDYVAKVPPHIHTAQQVLEQAKATATAVV